MLPAILVLLHIILHIFQFIKINNQDLDNKDIVYCVITDRSKLIANLITLYLSISQDIRLNFVKWFVTLDCLVQIIAYSRDAMGLTKQDDISISIYLFFQVITVYMQLNVEF